MRVSELAIFEFLFNSVLVCDSVTNSQKTLQSIEVQRFKVVTHPVTHLSHTCHTPPPFFAK